MSVWYLLLQKYFKCIVSLLERCANVLIAFFLAEIEKFSHYEDYFSQKEINIILMENVMTG